MWPGDWRGNEEALCSLLHRDCPVLYGVDWKDPLLYDLVVNLHHMKIDDACEMICYATTLDSYKITPELLKNIVNLALEKHIIAMIVADKSGSGKRQP